MSVYGIYMCKIHVIKNDYNFSSEDSLWATLSLGILLFVLFGVVWYSKMWRKYPEFYDTYGTGSDTAAETATEMAWSKYGHTTTVSLKGILIFYNVLYLIRTQIST